MSDRLRNTLLSLAAIGAVVLVGVLGWSALSSRASGGGASQALAPVQLPTPGARETTDVPTYETWQVGKAVGQVVVRARPDDGARVVQRLNKLNQSGFPTLLLVHKTRVVKGRTWYDVWLAKRPNGSRGWVKEGQLAFYTTSAKIEIDLGARRLKVFRRGEEIGSYPVAVGTPDLPTPTGFYFVNQKLVPSTTAGPFGVLAIGISAFQPKLPGWAQGGPVAIHGTNQPELIGKAVSHGCVRMRNKDVLEVSKYVPAGSPVEISK